jgi:hypothetical protein
MKNTQHNPTMMIKSKFSNLIHRLVDPCFGIKKHTKEYWECKNNERCNRLTEKQKAEKYDEIMKIYHECTLELLNYFTDRSYKKRVRKLREKKILETQI